MVDAYRRQSPLAHLSLEARTTEASDEVGVVMCERPFHGQFALRCEAGDGPLLDAIAAAIGPPVPLTANTASTGKRNTVLWLGPDEWLIVTPPGREARIEKALRQAIGDGNAALTDVSDSRTVIGLSGRHARDVLAKGCHLDLHPRTFGPGQCAQTVFARAHILLHQTGKAPDYEIYISRSFAAYLWAWLEDAAGEYGVAIVRD